MEKFRCFISIDFESSTIQQIQDLQKSIGDFGFQSIRWVPGNNQHLTLKFLGDTSTEIIPSIKLELDNLSNIFPIFELKPSKLGVFPGWNSPRILWLGLEHSNELLQIAEIVIKEMENLGFAPEERRFSPHLTLGRIKDKMSTVESAKLKEICSQMQIRIPTEKVRKINLYRSILKPSGAEYTLLHASFLLERNIPC